MKDANAESYECCIIGAGPAGLGVALELVKRGVTDIVIIDKNKKLGGLSRTEVFDGVRFDIGPHRFFTKNDEVNKIWHDILGSDFRTVSRLTRIFYKNKYFNYPIKPIDVLAKLGPLEALHSVLSFVSSQINKKNKVISFEDWITQKFGRKLYKTFFKTYTEKVWGIPCSQIGAEWAAQRIQGLDVFEVIKNALYRRSKVKTLVEEFDYPVLGAGQMYESMCSEIVASGAKLILESKAVSFDHQNNAIKSVSVVDPYGKQICINAKQFFSSVPLANFFKILNPLSSDEINKAAGMLRYRDHITVNLLINKENLFLDQWIYVCSSDIQMARVGNYNNFSELMVEREKTALSAEYFVFKNEGLWNETDEYLAQLATQELEKMELVKQKDVEKYWVVRETEAYPIHYLGFQDHYNLLKLRIDQFVNFYPIGRAGMHKYNNQDHSLISGVLAARNYLKLPGSPYVLWDINADAEYLENAQRTHERDF